MCTALSSALLGPPLSLSLSPVEDEKRGNKGGSGREKGLILVTISGG